MRFFVLLALLTCPAVWAQPFDGLSDAITEGELGKIKALLVARHGETLYEEYFLGHGPDDLHAIQSITKSVGSALIGVAHRQGTIRLDQKLDHFFGDLYPMDQPPYADKRDITVEQVLQQRHGIDWDELSLDYRDGGNTAYQMIRSDDWYDFVLSRPMATLPGETFAYSTGVSTLMSQMVRKASGLSPQEFARLELFGPLEIEEFHWDDGGTGNWPNPHNDPPLGYALRMKPRDLLKFGQLYLDGGVYQGRRILDASWIEATRKPHSDAFNASFFADRPGSGYGYQWWITTMTDTRGRAWQAYYAVGWGRQYVLVFPDLGLVVASVADDYDWEGPGIGTILRNYVLPELAPRLDRRFDGAWYDPAYDGQGLTLQILDDGRRLLGFWYTYGADGSKRWFMFDGVIDGSEAETPIYETEGGVFLQPDPVNVREWGRAHFVVIDCDHIQMKIDAAEIVTEIPLTRLSGSCTLSF
jgi:CubicO group peptidase (beta-lactamase class C family)